MPLVSPLGNANRKLGMWLFLSSELLIFCGLIFSFLMLKGWAEANQVKWGEVGGATLQLVTLNTFVLLASSYTVVKGIEAAQKNNRNGVFLWIMASGLLGTVFLFFQGVEYNNLISHEGHQFFTLIPAAKEPYATQDPFSTSFFTLTGLHGLHVLMGAIWAFAIALRGRTGLYHGGNLASIEMFGLYWHFVDLVWVLIFTAVYLLGA